MLPGPEAKSLSTNREQQRETLFLTLKQTVKARGITYATLAAALNVSELTIKRLFSERDCKMSRLLDICEAIGISLAELLEMQERRRQMPVYLEESVEHSLAKEPMLFWLFLLLTLQVDKARMCKAWSLSESEWYQRLRALEEMGLLRVLPQNQYQFTVSLPLRWRMNGPLGHYLQNVNAAFVRNCIIDEVNPKVEINTAGRLMSEQSAETMRESLRHLAQQFHYLATQDQLFFKSEDLSLYKIVLGLGPLQLESLLEQSQTTAK